MKTKFHTSPALASLIACGLFAGFAHGQGNSDPNAAQYIPAQAVGQLTAYPNIVQQGDFPTLRWHILHPSRIDDVAVVNPPTIPGDTGGSGSSGSGSSGSGSSGSGSSGSGSSGSGSSGSGSSGSGSSGSGSSTPTTFPPGTITITSNNTYVSIQPIGTGTTDCSTTPPSQQFTEARMSVNGSSYTQLFYGQSTDITPQYSLYIKKHKKGDKLNFGGRYVNNNNWTPFYSSLSANGQVISLRNGDAIPTSFPLHTSPQLAGFLGPYLDGAGKVKIGPMSVLVLMELGSTNPNQPCFDYQDMALLVTLAGNHPNNGHGNNLDGVDSSNPGKGKGGPTGLNNSGQDPSGGVDDERR